MNQRRIKLRKGAAWSLLDSHRRWRQVVVGAVLCGGQCILARPSSRPPPSAQSPRVGVLVVGLSGNNGATVAATLEAARQRASLEWESAQGPVRASDVVDLGCISQLRDGPCGEWLAPCRVGRLENMVLGGWDVRDVRVGDALYQGRILPHDLVRRVKRKLNGLPVWRGIYDESFVGPNQRATATHVTTPGVPSPGKGASKGTKEIAREVRKRQLEQARKDIRSFLRKHHMESAKGDHATVIWSATVERLSSFSPTTAQELLAAFYDDDDDKKEMEMEEEPDVSPSLIYATAAVLEGCSFVNGGSQNTICGGLLELAKVRRSEEGLPPAYVLGTDFKAGQTKFKTAALEYVRAVGLRPKVLASSNHLGNNDMRSLLFPAAVQAKLRVKHDIFGPPWRLTKGANDGGGGGSGEANKPFEEGSLEAIADPYRHSRPGLDHKVKVSYTDFIGDEKRDIAEYTALGSLGSPWTMLTYTRAMDSILCAPLMLDAAAWCAAFASAGIPPEEAAPALAYLFKVPEGAAEGGDPGFFAQMDVLKATLRRVAEGHYEAAQRGDPSGFSSHAASEGGQVSGEGGTTTSGTTTSGGGGGVWANDEELPGAIACAGLACLDMQLLEVASGGGGGNENENGGGGGGGKKKNERRENDEEGGGDDNNNDDDSDDVQAIRPFESVVTCAGGSAPQAAAALARLRVRGCCIARVGRDANGRELKRLLRAAGAHPNSECFIDDGDSGHGDSDGGGRPPRHRRRSGRGRGTAGAAVGQTSIAVLPIFQDGRRGCFVDLGANNRLTPDNVLAGLSSAADKARGGELPAPRRALAALHFGYPHLLPRCGGRGLRRLLREVHDGGAGGVRRDSSSRRAEERIRGRGVEGFESVKSSRRLLVSVDVNGVTSGNAKEKEGGGPLPREALRYIDILHMNEDEAALLVEHANDDENDDGDEGVELRGAEGADPKKFSESDDLVERQKYGAGLPPQCEDEAFCRRAAKWAHARGVAVLVLTLGSRGSFVSLTSDATRLGEACAAAQRRPGGGGGGGAAHSMAPAPSEEEESQWKAGQSVRLAAFAVAPAATANANGAGDAFCVAFVAAMLWQAPALSLREAAVVASLAALHRVDSTLRRDDDEDNDENDDAHKSTPSATLRTLVVAATTGVFTHRKNTKVLPRYLGDA